MAEGKTSFLLYADYIHTFELLTDEQAGRLIKHIFDYVNDKNPESDDLIIKLAFGPIKRQLKRDLKEWHEEKISRIGSGTLGNIARWHPNLYTQILNKQLTIEQALEIIQSEKSADSDGSQADKTDRTESEGVANIAVTVTVNDTVTDKENNTIISSDEEMGKKAPIVGVQKSGLKKNVLPKKKVAAKKKGKNPDAEPYWKQIRAKWVWFNKTHLRFNVEPIPERDYSHIHRIIEKLRERAIGQAVLWTEENALSRWEKFLTVAYTKDGWLHDNFLAANLESKMQKIFNLIDNPNGQHKKSGQGSTTSSVGKTIEFDQP